MNKDFVQACAKMHGGVLEHAYLLRTISMPSK